MSETPLHSLVIASHLLASSLPLVHCCQLFPCHSLQSVSVHSITDMLLTHCLSGHMSQHPSNTPSHCSQRHMYERSSKREIVSSPLLVSALPLECRCSRYHCPAHACQLILASPQQTIAMTLTHPLPKRPLAPVPQQYALPSLPSPQECCAPVATVTNLTPVIILTSTGTLVLALPLMAHAREQQFRTHRYA